MYPVSSGISGDDWHNDTKIWHVVELLFQDLSRAFKKGTLAHYFIPEMNVLENFNATLTEQCYRKIQDVIVPNLKTIITVDEVKRATEFLDEIVLIISKSNELQPLDAHVYKFKDKFFKYSKFCSQKYYIALINIENALIRLRTLS